MSELEKALAWVAELEAAILGAVKLDVDGDPWTCLLCGGMVFDFDEEDPLYKRHGVKRCRCIRADIEKRKQKQ